MGASGIVGYTLTTLLKRHPAVSIELLHSQSCNKKKVVDEYPESTDKKLTYTDISIDDINNLGLDLIFLCLESGRAMEIVPKLKARIIDMSADYRFSDPQVYESVYKIAHQDKKRSAVYGLPELFREKIKTANIVANPGCYATACILSALPLQKIAHHIIFDCKSGYSGAGKNSVYMQDHSIIQDNIIAYNIAKHRHKYEIAQLIEGKISFTPHVIATYEGLMCTMHALLKRSSSEDEIRHLYQARYKQEHFIEIAREIPDLHQTQKTNKYRIGGFAIDESGQLVTVATIDNLYKGAAGQAIQNMNIMFGFDETEGLE